MEKWRNARISTPLRPADHERDLTLEGRSNTHDLKCINVALLNLFEVDVQLYSLPSTQRAKAELPFQLLIGSFDDQSHRQSPTSTTSTCCIPKTTKTVWKDLLPA